ncbi:uncharacterized protein LOC116414396 [Apis florea]|uniref:uncharacterized protein LOC116414396 n=1 Tax=Apis florea TaxID=7463 RepID=UPI0012FF057F|nr:uncharacterized protein LOC116414396 [Apis florea]
MFIRFQFIGRRDILYETYVHVICKRNIYDIKKYKESDKDRYKVKIRKSAPSPECRKRNVQRKDRRWKEKDRDKKFREFDVISKNCQNSWKNSSNDLLSTYVLLIQNRIFGQNFCSFDYMEISKNLTSFLGILKIPRT